MMKLNDRLIGLIVRAIATFTLWITMVAPVFAFPQGTLISSEHSTLDIYPQPNLEQPSIGTAEVGDPLMILEQAYNNQGEIWDHIRLLIPPKTEGWIPDSYVKKDSVETFFDDPYDPKNYYQPNQFN